MKVWECTTCGTKLPWDMNADQCPSSDCESQEWVEDGTVTGKDILEAAKKRFKSDHCQAAFVKGARWYKSFCDE